MDVYFFYVKKKPAFFLIIMQNQISETVQDG